MNYNLVSVDNGAIQQFIKIFNDFIIQLSVSFLT